MEKQTVKFLQYCEVEAQGEIEQSFDEGEVITLPYASAQFWVKRNKAVVVEEDGSQPKPKPKPKAKPRGRPPKTKSITDYDLPGKPDRSKIIDREKGNA